MSTTMTVRVGDDFKNRLDVLAQATQRGKSFLASQAPSEYQFTNSVNRSSHHNPPPRTARAKLTSKLSRKKTMPFWESTTHTRS